jgi:hypothetical protein
MSERAPAIAQDVSEPLARFFRETRELCGGDLDKAQVLLEVIVRANQHPRYRRLKPAELEGDRAEAEPALPSLGTNVRSIAASTGIPKESVRRKVLELIEAGWVVREGRNLHFSVEGYHAVAPAREAMYRMYARAYEVVSCLLEDVAQGRDEDLVSEVRRTG